MNTTLSPQDSLALPIMLEPDPAPRPVRWLKHAMKMFPETGRKVNEFRQNGLSGLGPDWPDWCFLPPACFGIIVEDALGRSASEKEIATDMPILGALATWRYSQGIYRIEPFLLKRIAATPLNGKMPVEQLHHLPEWCIYVETPGMEWSGEPLLGFWATLSWNFETHAETLLVVLDKESALETCLLDVGPWSVKEGVQKVFGFTKASCLMLNEPDFSHGACPVKTAQALTPLVAIVLYLCSDTAEIEHEHAPGLRPTYPRAKKTRYGWKMFPPAKHTVWKVGKKAATQS